MENEIRELLGEEIKNEIENLSSLEPGSDEHSTAVESLTKLYKLKIEETKNELDYDEKYSRRVMERKQFEDELILKQNQAEDEACAKKRDEKLRQDQLKEQVKERYFKIGLGIVELLIPLMFYGAWVNKGLEFEKEGTFTSSTFRSLIQKFKPTKK